jgi:hypothetical protein
MKKRLLILFIFVSLCSYSQSIKKTFKEIQIGNIDKAYNELQKITTNSKLDNEEEILFQLGR